MKGSSSHGDAPPLLDGATVAAQDLGVDPMASITSEEADERRDVLGHAEPAQRRLGDVPLHVILRLAGVHHGCPRGPWRHHVGRDPRAAQLARQDLGHHLHRRLARRVRRVARAQRPDPRRREGHDAAAAVADQPPGRLAAAQEGAARVGAERGVERRLAGLRQRRVGVVQHRRQRHQDVELLAEGRRRRVEQRLYLRRVRHVRLHRDGTRLLAEALAGVAGVDAAHQRQSRRRVADVRHHDARAERRQVLRHGRADAAGTTGDNGYAAVEHHRCRRIDTAAIPLGFSHGIEYYVYVCVWEPFAWWNSSWRAAI